MEVKVWEFLNTDDYEIESSKLVSIFVSSIVKPDDVLGFIYSFFTDWENQNLKINILQQFGSNFKQLNSNFIFSNKYRDSNLFNEVKNEIILTDDEIEYINQSYFIKILEQKYSDVFSNLDSFHRHFRKKKDFSLLQTYEMLLININERKSIFYNRGNIKNSAGLNIISFKDAVLKKNLLLKEALIDKILTLDVPQEDLNKYVTLPDKSRSAILNELIASKKDLEKYIQYESKLVEHQYLSRDKNQWLNNATGLIRFYSFCERESVFKEKYSGVSRGVKLMRKLYNFHINTSMDAPTKRKEKSHFTDLAFLKY